MTKKLFTHQSFLKKNLGGFTLIELLVVIAVIALLSGIVFVWVSDAIAKARDAKRTEELYQLKLAFELYYDDYGHYPVWTTPGSDEGVCIEEGEGKTELESALVAKGYISSLSRDPKYNSSACSGGLFPFAQDCFCYTYKTDTDQKYKTFAIMEKENENARGDGGVYDRIYEVYSPTPGSDQIVYEPKPPDVSVSCSSNDNCSVTQFCEFPIGECKPPGICVEVPKYCPSLYEPVCGCDNKTYSNDCVRKMAKVSKAYDGGCVISYTYTLTVSKTGTGTGTVTSSPAGINCGTDCSEAYASGTKVTLTATPDANSSFAGWSGCDSIDLTTCFVTMNANKSVTATFNTTITTCGLTVSKTGTGSGTVSISPLGTSCPAIPEVNCYSYTCGTTVTLQATPAIGSTFAGWSGACTGTGTCTLTMNANKSVTATFNILITFPAVTNDGGASSITSNSARLNGEITSTGGENPTIHIYWGDNDGGTNPANWDHDENLGTKGLGPFFKDISGLNPNTTYYYRCYASNSAGSDWADSSAVFLTTSAEVYLNWSQAIPAAAWSPRNNYNNSVVYNNKMWILGGGSAAGYINDVWSSSDGINWTRATQNAAWPGRKNHTPLVYNNKMWVMGGTDGITVKNDVWYSTDGINWTRATPSAAWSARHAYSSVVYDNKMWILGGVDASGVKNDVWYSTDGINWTQATSSAGWSARAYSPAIVYGNKLWIIGGVEVNDVWYSTDGINWTRATSVAPWSARYRHTSVVYDNKMWVLGGNTGTGEGLKNDVWYSTDGKNWSGAISSGSCWSARENHTSVVYNNKIWVLGGGDASGLKNDVWYGVR